jgi:hypothetical protein
MKVVKSDKKQVRVKVVLISRGFDYNKKLDGKYKKSSRRS